MLSAKKAIPASLPTPSLPLAPPSSETMVVTPVAAAAAIVVFTIIVRHHYRASFAMMRKRIRNMMNSHAARRELRRRILAVETESTDVASSPSCVESRPIVSGIFIHPGKVRDMGAARALPVARV